MGLSMHRSEAQFCLDEAARLQSLVKQCKDKKVRDHLRQMSDEWVERAKVKQPEPPLANTG